MEDTEEIRKKIARLITERGLNYAKVSLSIGKNIAYIQQFIKNGSPRRLGEVERQKLARLLKVDEQELTDLPLKMSSSSAPSVNQDILCLIIENIENSCNVKYSGNLYIATSSSPSVSTTANIIKVTSTFAKRYTSTIFSTVLLSSCILLLGIHVSKNMLKSPVHA